MLEICAVLNLMMLGFLLCDRTRRMRLACPGGAPVHPGADARRFGDGDLLFFHANPVSSALVTRWTHAALVHRPASGRVLLYEVTPTSLCPTLRPVRAAVRECLSCHQCNRVAWRRRRRHGGPPLDVARGIAATRRLSYRHYWWMIMLRRCWPGMSLPEGGTTSATFCCDLILRVLGEAGGAVDDEGQSWLPDDMARAWPAHYDPLVEVVVP